MGKHHDDALCAQASSSLLHHVVDVAAAATDLSRDCERKPKISKREVDEPTLTSIVDIQTARLFESGEGSQTSVNYTSLIIGAFLPITAVLGFVGGRAHGNSRHRATQIREVDIDVGIMSDVELSSVE